MEMNIEFEIATMDQFDEIFHKAKKSFADISEKYLGNREILPPRFGDGSFFQKTIKKDQITNIVVDDEIVGGYHIQPYSEGSDDL